MVTLPFGKQSRCAPHPQGLLQVHSPFLWTARIPFLNGFIPQIGLSQLLNRPLSAYEAALFVFVLRSVNSADTPDWVHLPISKLYLCHVGARSAPVLLRVPAPSLYTKRVIGVTNSFQFVRL